MSNNMLMIENKNDKNEYVEALLHPFQAGNDVFIPDNKGVLSATKISNMSLNVSGVTTLVFRYQPFYRQDRLIWGSMVADPSSGIMVPGWRGVIPEDAKLSETYSQARLVSGGVRIWCSTVTTTNSNLQGQYSAAVLYDRLGRVDYNPSQLTGFNSPYAIPNSSLFSECIMLALPIDVPAYFSMSGTTQDPSGNCTVFTARESNSTAKYFKSSAVLPGSILPGSLPQGEIMEIDPDATGELIGLDGFLEVSVSWSKTLVLGSVSCSSSIKCNQLIRATYLDGTGTEVDCQFLGIVAETPASLYTPQAAMGPGNTQLFTVNKTVAFYSPFPIYRIRSSVSTVALNLGGDVSNTTPSDWYGYCTVKAYDFAPLNRAFPSLIVSASGIDANATVSLQGRHAYEVIPDAKLSRDLSLTPRRIVDIQDFQHALRFCSKCPPLLTSADYMRLSGLSTQRDFVARAGFFDDLWSGIKKAGSVVYSAVKPFVPGIVKGITNELGLATPAIRYSYGDGRVNLASLHDPYALATASDISMASSREVSGFPPTEKKAELLVFLSPHVRMVLPNPDPAGDSLESEDILTLAPPPADGVLDEVEDILSNRVAPGHFVIPPDKENPSREHYELVKSEFRYRFRCSYPNNTFTFRDMESLAKRKGDSLNFDDELLDWVWNHLSVFGYAPRGSELWFLSGWMILKKFRAASMEGDSLVPSPWSLLLSGEATTDDDLTDLVAHASSIEEYSLGSDSSSSESKNSGAPVNLLSRLAGAPKVPIPVGNQKQEISGLLTQFRAGERKPSFTNPIGKKSQSAPRIAAFPAIKRLPGGGSLASKYLISTTRLPVSYDLAGPGYTRVEAAPGLYVSDNIHRGFEKFYAEKARVEQGSKMLDLTLRKIAGVIRFCNLGFAADNPIFVTVFDPFSEHRLDEQGVVSIQSVFPLVVGDSFLAALWTAAFGISSGMVISGSVSFYGDMPYGFTDVGDSLAKANGFNRGGTNVVLPNTEMTISVLDGVVPLTTVGQILSGVEHEPSSVLLANSVTDLYALIKHFDQKFADESQAKSVASGQVKTTPKGFITVRGSSVPQQVVHPPAPETVSTTVVIRNPHTGAPSSYTRDVTRADLAKQAQLIASRNPPTTPESLYQRDLYTEVARAIQSGHGVDPRYVNGLAQAFLTESIQSTFGKGRRTRTVDYSNAELPPGDDEPSPEDGSSSSPGSGNKPKLRTAMW